MSSKSEIQTIHQATYARISPKRPELCTKGKNLLISGGGSGIGAAISRSFAESGITNLGILGRNEKSLLETKAELQKLSPETTVWVYSVDLADAKATQSAVAGFAASINGKVDILVANAGYLPNLSTIVDSDPDDWWQGFETSVRGNFNLLRAFHPVAAERATVLHISSSVIHIPFMPGYSGYRSSKIAAYRLFDYYHHENPEFTLIHIHPGLIGGTAMESKLSATVDELGLAYDDVRLPGDFTVWAASEEARFLDGRFVWATWDVDELVQMKMSLAQEESRFTLGLFT